MQQQRCVIESKDLHVEGGVKGNRIRPTVLDRLFRLASVDPVARGFLVLELLLITVDGRANTDGTTSSSVQYLLKPTVRRVKEGMPVVRAAPKVRHELLDKRFHCQLMRYRLLSPLSILYTTVHGGLISQMQAPYRTTVDNEHTAFACQMSVVKALSCDDRDTVPVHHSHSK